MGKMARKEKVQTTSYSFKQLYFSLNLSTSSYTCAYQRYVDICIFGITYIKTRNINIPSKKKERNYTKEEGRIWERSINIWT